MGLRDGSDAPHQGRTLTASSMVAQMLLGFLRGHGCTVEDLPAAAGVSASEVADVDARIPLAALLLLWEAAAQRIGSDTIGLTMAQAPPTGVVSIINQAVLCSANLGECWRHVIRFQHLASDGAGLRLEEEGESVFLRFRPPEVVRAFPRYVPEFALASCLVGGRRATGSALLPRAARFQHGKARSLSAHEELFGTQVFFDQPRCELEFDRDILRLPVKCADQAMAILMERYAEEWLARLHIPSSLLDQVRRHVYAELQSGVPSVAAIAKRLHMSERSLSRRLQQEGLSYPKLVDTVRKELAAVYLNKRNIKLTEVAFLLGFSEISAFYRAYRRWTGKTPREARAASAVE